MTRQALIAVVMFVVAGAVQVGSTPPAAGPIALERLQAASGSRQVAVWYRGAPPGQPQLQDLVAIRAMGFRVIVWPGGSPAGQAELDRMAGVAGLSVLKPDESDGAADRAMVHLRAADHDAKSLGARAWRHIQEGARIVAFDPGVQPGESGPGLADASGRLLPWVEPARALARQLSVNAVLFDQLRPGPPVSVRTDASDLLVSLFQTSRSWVLFATSLDGRPTHVEASLPPAIPAALWVSLLDGSGMSMLSRPDGPLWRAEMPAYGTYIYVIDRAAGGAGS